MSKQEYKFSIVFVILHYMVENETIDAIEHIKRNIDTTEYHIVVVDNASSNDSYNHLRQKYKDDSEITLLHSDINLGFAKGNNLGYRYAKEEYNPEFIVLMNNDVNLIDTCFYEKLKIEYKKSKFALAGPAILSKEDDSIKPLPSWQREFPTLDYCNFRIKDMKDRIFWCNLKVYRKVCPFLRRTICKKMGWFKNPGTPIAGLPEDENLSTLETVYDTVIHGCFLIFSKSYIDIFDDGLDSRTFLYGEERILFLRVLSKKLRTAYIPKIKVVHLGARSSVDRIKKQPTNKEIKIGFKRDMLSYQICKEYLLDFYKENCIEIQDWWNKTYKSEMKL